jgi:TetR/AcrR family transcriptional regulator, tetracycline repressor protein
MTVGRGQGADESPARGAGRARGTGRAASRNTISAEAVVETALQIVESEGLERLTVRRLSEKLSVAVTSIYWHVGDKDTLLDAVADRIVSRFGRLTVSGARPRPRLESAARRLRAMLRDQADLVALVHGQGRTAELLQPARRQITRELVDAGLDGQEVALGAQAILNHVIGSVLLDRQMERQPAQRRTPEELWLADAEAGAHRPGIMQALTRPVDAERQFRYSSSRLISAILTK